jgi:glycosyltransferase involved in cell wall biosynthesis
VHSVGTYGLAALVAGAHPLIATAWGSDVLFGGRSAFRRPIIQAVLDRAELITCDARHMIKAMEALGTPGAKIKLVYFGVEVDTFRPGIPSDTVRERFGLGQDPVILSLRSLEPVYDVETLVRAAPRVLAEFPRARFMVAGGGSERARLESLASALGAADNLHFIGPIPHPELPALLNATDIYVSTALSDAGIAASTAEAMACGVPVVITNSGENDLWVKDGVDGLLVPGSDPEALADRLIRLLRNEELRRTFAQQGRAVIVERNNYEIEMGKVRDLYLDLCRFSRN